MSQTVSTSTTGRVDRIKECDIVKMLVGGYMVAEGTIGIVREHRTDGVYVSWYVNGQASHITVPNFTLRRVKLLKVERWWNLFRGNEVLIAKILNRWGISSIRVDTDTRDDEVGKLKYTVEQETGTTHTRFVKSYSEALHFAMELGFLLRVDLEPIKTEKIFLQSELGRMKEEVRAL